MSRLIDLIGKKFGRLVAKQRINNNKQNRPQWLCKCDCGKEKIVSGKNLRDCHTKSCGCLNKEIITKHKHSKTRIYYVWGGILQRCNNPKCKAYKDYGGRGIIVCQRWLKFENFLKDMDERPTANHSIHRIDNNKGYYKENCRWVTLKEQVNNKRNNTIIPYNSSTQKLYELIKRNKVNNKKLYMIICKYDWLIQEILDEHKKLYNE